MNPQNKRRLIVLWALFVICGWTVALCLGIPYLNYECKKMWCKEDISLLYHPLRWYADDHNGQYPPGNRWCDLLIEETAEVARYFVCKGGSPARSHYAINANAKPDSPDDVVLLFETNGGWNQSGGPELLTTENHKGKGCNVLYVGGHVQFVRSKDIDKLRWQVGLEVD